MKALDQQKEPLPATLHKEHIQTGREAQERETKQEKRRILMLRSLVAILSFAFLEAAGLGAYAYNLWQKEEIEQIESLAKQSNTEFLAGQKKAVVIV